MMDYKNIREEALREAACLGDLKTLEDLILMGVDVNSQNRMNGWTALHWAAWRGNAAAVTILLKNGANKASVTSKGETPCYLASTNEVRSLLDGNSYILKKELKLPITPNYLRNPPLCCPRMDHGKAILAKDLEKDVEKDEKELILRLEVEEDPQEFVEIEIPSSKLTFETLRNICAEELDVYPVEIVKILKLPNTHIRSDKDLLRLKDFQEISCVLSGDQS